MSVPATEQAAPAAPPAVPATPAVPAVPAGDPSTTPPAVPGQTDDKPLGPNGEKALQAERDARKELEKQVAALAPLQKLVTALGGGDPGKAKTEIEQLTERQAEFERQVAEERAARWRAEVANEKGLTADQAGRLHGATREELAADADKLVTQFGITPSAPGTPRPDPSQGARPDGAPNEIDTQIAAAVAKGDVMESIRLKTIKQAQNTTK